MKWLRKFISILLLALMPLVGYTSISPFPNVTISQSTTLTFTGTTGTIPSNNTLTSFTMNLGNLTTNAGTLFDAQGVTLEIYNNGTGKSITSGYVVLSDTVGGAGVSKSYSMGSINITSGSAVTLFVQFNSGVLKTMSVQVNFGTAPTAGSVSVLAYVSGRNNGSTISGTVSANQGSAGTTPWPVQLKDSNNLSPNYFQLSTSGGLANSNISLPTASALFALYGSNFLPLISAGGMNNLTTSSVLPSFTGTAVGNVLPELMLGYDSTTSANAYRAVAVDSSGKIIFSPSSPVYVQGAGGNSAPVWITGYPNPVNCGSLNSVAAPIQCGGGGGGGGFYGTDFTITGTWSGTLTFYYEDAFGNFNVANAYPVGTNGTLGSPVTSTTTNGTFWVPAYAGNTDDGIAFTSYTSGTANIHAIPDFQHVMIGTPLPPGTNTIGSVAQSGTWNVNSAQSGTWNVGLNAGTNNIGSVNAVQSGTWNVNASGTVTSNQGTPNTNANGWPVKVTDGTNVLGTSTNPNIVGGSPKVGPTIPVLNFGLGAPPTYGANAGVGVISLLPNGIFFSVQGATGKNLYITGITLSCVNNSTTSQSQIELLIGRATAISGGTSTNIGTIALNGNGTSSGATVVYYTAAPSATAYYMFSRSATMDESSATGGPSFVTFDIDTSKYGEPIIIPSSQWLVIDSIYSTGNPSCNVNVTWMEF